MHIWHFRSRFALRSASIAAAFVIGLGLTSMPAGATPQEEPGTSPGGAESSEIAENLDLVAGLTGTDECLWRMSVFPEGGVGYEETLSALDPVAAAFQRYRDALLRAYPDTLMDVLFEEDASGSVHAVAVSAIEDVTASLDSLLLGSTASSLAATVLSALGVSLEVVTDSASTRPTMLQACAIQDALLGLQDDNGSPIPIYVAPDATDGSVIVHVSAQYVDLVMSAAGASAKWLKIETVEGLEDAGRTNGAPPWYGGARISDAAGSSCTSSFRVIAGGGTWNGMLTADHCPGPYVSNGMPFGSRASSLAAAKVDAVLAVGSTYSPRVWTGALNTSTSIPANGIYPYYTLRANDSLFISGASSGQSTLSYTGKVNGNGCVTTASGTWCQILQSTAAGGHCIAGDSGGPVGVYDQVHGRIISLGIVKARSGSPDVAHPCYFTNTMAISYLYGGAAIG